jgi:organic hydroperoxide reductase OsmC/OhrA
MEKEHTYRVMAWWTSGQAGLTKSESAPNAVHFAAPPQFGGLEGRWTPEDLLLSAVASCFTTTFHAVSGYAKFAYTDLEVAVEGTVDKTQTGYGFTRIVIRPRLMISDQQEEARASDLLTKAKGLCLIARALAIAQEFEPHVGVGTMV